MTHHNFQSSSASPVIINVDTTGEHHVESFSLRDFFLIFLRYRYTFLSGFIVVLCGFLLTFIFSPKQYTFSTEITLGSKPVFNELGIPETSLIQPLESAKFRLLHSIIPLLHYNSPNVEIDVSIPRNTDLLLVSSIGEESERTQITTAHKNIIEALAESHKKASHVEHNLLRAELEVVKNTLKELNTQTFTEASGSSPEMQSLKSRIHVLKRSLALYTETRSELGTVRSVRPHNKDIITYSLISTSTAIFVGLFFVLIRYFVKRSH